MPPTITEAHPPMPLDEVTALVAEFPSMSLTQKKQAIDRLVAVHPTFNVDWGGGWTYRRCRVLSGDAPPEHVDELIWRKGIPAALGRANPEGFQVLYLADRQDTALQEARATDDDYVVLAEFQFQAGQSIFVAPIGEFSQIQRSGRGFLSGDQSSVVSGMLNACPLDEARSLLITDAFLLDCFVGHDDYELSSHVAHSVFAKLPQLSAIAYPSRRQYGAINFAVRTEDFWQRWALAGGRFGRARHLGMGYFSLTEVQSIDGVMTSGQLRWKSVDDERARLILEPPYVPLAV